MLLNGPVLHEAANDQSKQWHRFHTGKNRPDRQPQRRAAVPEIVMGRAENSAEERKGGRKVGNAKRAGSRSQPHCNKQHGNYGHAEELKNAFDPDVHNKPSPVIGNGQMGPAAEQKSESKKDDDQDGAKHVKIHQALEILVPDPGRAVAHRAVNNEEPRQQSDEKQNLPQPSQFEIFPALVSKPEP